MFRENTPSSVVINIDPQDNENCITDFTVTVNGSQCSKKTPAVKYNWICNGLDLYSNLYQFNITAKSKWIDSSSILTESFKANGRSKL